MDDLHLCVLFYRLFLKEIKSYSETHVSTIKEKLAAMGPALDHFQKLHMKNSRFIWRKHHRSDNEQEKMILNWSSEPPPPLPQRKN